MERITQALRELASRGQRTQLPVMPPRTLVSVEEAELLRLCDQIDAVDASLAAEVGRLRAERASMAEELARAQGDREGRRDAAGADGAADLVAACEGASRLLDAMADSMDAGDFADRCDAPALRLLAASLRDAREGAVA